MNELDYRRIQTGVETVNGEGFVHVQDAEGKLTTEWNEYWLERLNDYHNLFVSELELPIANAIGETGWKVRFTQVSPYPEKPPFLVDIYCNNSEHIVTIVSLINSMLIADSLKLDFFTKPF